MKYFALTALAMICSLALFAQTDTTTPRPKTTVPLPRANDHFMLQLGHTTWLGAPDSLQLGGLPRTFNMYFLFDFPFKTNTRFSTAIGAGVATDNVFFDKMSVELAGNSTNLQFRDLSDTNHYKKYKVHTTYIEAPIELRFRSNPENDRRSFKAAIGVKVGLLVNAHTKGKGLENRNGNDIGNHTQKMHSKQYFNSNRISLTGRVGYGNFSLFGSYAATPLFKEGVAAQIRPLTVGLTISGL
ncbi:outer membrane beta-barrel protein [Pseudocnuella soli]|uniref:outer membrane beta-barrel protein n=1 Tax=Pseudocnuella soli TaxID=2502779 RepID=UPI00104764A3|nr:outer membrane beta-barrel protein [Pseudocnuella soli]